VKIWCTPYLAKPSPPSRLALISSLINCMWDIRAHPNAFAPIFQCLGLDTIQPSTVFLCDAPHSKYLIIVVGEHSVTLLPSDPLELALCCSMCTNGRRQEMVEKGKVLAIYVGRAIAWLECCAPVNFCLLVLWIYCVVDN
jgi:hypothetical protein